MSKNLYMSDAQYIGILVRLKDQINNVRLRYFDDTTPGDKSTMCTWGLCDDESKMLFPTSDLHLFPKEFPERRAPKYFRKDQPCPNDYDPANQNGCFYHCRFFQRKSDGWGKQEIFTKIDELIEKARKRK